MPIGIPPMMLGNLFPSSSHNGQRMEPRVKVGDKVLIAKWGGSEIKLNDVEHVFLRENELLAILDE